MQQPHKPSRISIILAFAAVYVIWGSTYLGIKYAIQTMPPLLMSGVRYFIAGLIVFIIAMSTGAPFPKKIYWRNTFIIGALLVLMGNGGVALAESLIPSGIASLIVCSVPMWFALIGWLFFNKGSPGFYRYHDSGRPEKYFSYRAGNQPKRCSYNYRWKHWLVDRVFVCVKS